MRIIATEAIVACLAREAAAGFEICARWALCPRERPEAEDQHAKQPTLVRGPHAQPGRLRVRLVLVPGAPAVGRQIQEGQSGRFQIFLDRESRWRSVG